MITFTGFTLEAPKFKEDEHSDMSFFASNELADLDLAFNHRELLENFFEKHNSGR
jgi:hypothetical protein